MKKVLAPLPLALLAIGLLGTSAQAQTTSNWVTGAAGAYNWNDAVNWTNGVPNGDTFRAAFNVTSALSGTYDVTLATDVTVGRLTNASINPTTATVNLLGDGNITLRDSTGTDQATIQRNANSPLLFINNNISLDDANGVTLNGNFRINGAISGNSTISVTGGPVFIGAGNTFTSNVNLVGVGLYATAANSYSGASTGTYTFNNTGTNSVAVGNAANVGVTFNNALVFNATSTTGRVQFMIGRDAASILEVTTSSITDNGTTANGNVEIGRIDTSNVQFSSYGIVAGTGTGAVKFSGTGFTVNRNVQGGGNTAILELSPASGTQTWSGSFTAFTGSSNIVKTGAGTVIIGSSGSNHTYASQTRVDAGTLILNGTFTQAAASTGGGLASSTTGRFQVESGATLQVAGQINVGLTTNTNANNAMLVKSGGFLAPGANGIGDLVFNGAGFGANRSGGNDRQLNMATGSRFSFDLAGDGTSADRIDFWSYVNGDLLFNSNAINLTLTGPIVANTYTVDLFRFYSDGGTTLTASGIASGLTVGTLGTGISSANITYGTNAIQLQYTTVPEPATWALLAGGLTALVIFRRRPRRLLARLARRPVDRPRPRPTHPRRSLLSLHLHRHRPRRPARRGAPPPPRAALRPALRRIH